MCALAASLYANPSKTTVCYGDAGYMSVIWLEWFSMGSFFLSISVTVLLSADLSGVPDGLLLRHLQRNQRLHATPMVLTAAGLFLLASGYGVDVDERAGCRLKWLGVVLAPCFPIILVAFAAYLRARRGAEGMALTAPLGASRAANTIPLRAAMFASFFFLSRWTGFMKIQD